MAAVLSLDELAKRTGEPAQWLLRLRELGLLGAADQAGGFDHDAAERVRLVQLLERRGVALEAIARAEQEQGGMLDRYLAQINPAGDWPTISLEEAGERSGLESAVVRRVLEASGQGEDGDVLGEEDVGALQGFAAALAAGFPEEALFQMLRVYADALGRVAEAEARLFHFYVHERLKAQGLPVAQLIETSAASSDQLQGLVEPTILYFHRKGLARAAREDLVMHMAEASGLLPASDLEGQLPVAVVFIDLSSFTTLAEAMGDAAAARVLERFSALVRPAAGRCDGRVVKQIGDAFMIAFADVAAAVACGLSIRELAGLEAQFPAVRLGAHTGTVLYREGDYVGTNVNIAARVTAEAQRNQFLVTEAVREAAATVDAEFRPLGSRPLKGITDEVTLFEVIRRGAAERSRPVDPVCGMELDPEAVETWLTSGGRRLAFCSGACLQRFVAAPERYVAS